MPLQCKKIKVDGEQCKAYRIHKSKFCFWHSLRMQEKRVEARKRGGLNRRRDLNEDICRYHIKTYNDIQRILEKMINDLLVGKITTRKARAIGLLCKLAKDIQSKAEFEREDLEDGEIMEEKLALLVRGINNS